MYTHTHSHTELVFLVASGNKKLGLGEQVAPMYLDSRETLFVKWIKITGQTNEICAERWLVNKENTVWY